MARIERLIKASLIILFLLLILSQWVVIQTDLNTYLNPVYEYIGVQKLSPTIS
ncbi:hypothetical protein SAMN05421676_11073 [Salinibacillus kushneri]|uniref:Uncharacterized protein n=1 Tax=Salinibacillus kushneri TaxID=237682 RepID=A0A1I0I1Z8_9BACI|nr:DUF5359 family protein [Salinibacillus kushneri]SET89719.1 hypothetical protein SAMN05421676_11073 [Salinibacillus kushneri]